MHELSVCQALLMQVDEISRTNGNAAVGRVTIEMGPLSGVDPLLLRNAFEIMRRGGSAATAELLVTEVDVLIECLACHLQCAALPNRLLCAACGGFRTRIVAGDELRLLRVEMTS